MPKRNMIRQHTKNGTRALTGDNKIIKRQVSDDGACDLFSLLNIKKNEKDIGEEQKIKEAQENILRFFNKISLEKGFK